MTDYSAFVNRVGDHWKKKYGKKIYKITFHGDFTCPNLDGTVGSKGCIYCNMGSLEPYMDRQKGSIEDHIRYLKERNGAEGFIAYFQDYSSTYPSKSISDSCAYLKKLYTESTGHPDIVGISVSTRPDCIDTKVLDILKSLDTGVVIELGLQTINEKDLDWINRGHTVEQFSKTVELVSSYGFETVAHIILGLPNETDETIVELAEFINSCDINGVKIHNLMILKNSRLEKLYRTGKAPDILTEIEYFRRLGVLISHLDRKVVIHRLYGDAPAKELIAPLWVLNKTAVQDRIFKYFKENGIKQGSEL